jgi:glucose-1-phosphate adenylyltransferase
MTIVSLPKHRTDDLKPQKERNDNTLIDMKRVAVIILGGGQGTRLFPLTATCCKPAACVGGKNRLIDIPISNALNSGCSRIFIITQFLSTSLHKHIIRTYQLGSIAAGSIELLAAEQRPTQQSWFQGTADAVRQNIEYFIHTPAEYYLILSGDQLYKMDFQHMMHFARETDADLTVAALPVAETEATRMGLLKVNEDRLITEFHEKPQERAILDHMRLPDFTLRQMGEGFDQERKYLGSMGIYLFKRQALLDLLKLDLREDFGKHLIPTKVKQGKTAAYLFDGYWEDIGTIGAYFKANMALTNPRPPLNYYDENFPIFSQLSHLPAPKIMNTRVKDSIICEGSVVEADIVQSSILGPRTIVKEGTVIRNSYLIGNEFYAPPMSADNLSSHFKIGSHCLIDHAIIDKNVHIGDGVQLVNKRKLTHFNSDNVFIRDGIIVVSAGARLPDGYVL